jgi:hypothetical protein
MALAASLWDCSEFQHLDRTFAISALRRRRRSFTRDRTDDDTDNRHVFHHQEHWYATMKHRSGNFRL